MCFLNGPRASAARYLLFIEIEKRLMLNKVSSYHMYSRPPHLRYLNTLCGCLLWAYPELLLLQPQVEAT